MRSSQFAFLCFGAVGQKSDITGILSQKQRHLIVSTGDIGSEARRYANSIMAQSNLAVVMLDGADLKRIMEQPVSIIDIFEREAHSAMRLKKLEIEK